MVAALAGTLLAQPLSTHAQVTPSVATLSILAGHVFVAQGGGDYGPAAPGLGLAIGDRVRVDVDGAGLITFYDGSESQLDGGAEVEVGDDSADGGRGISLFQFAGTTVSRVQHLTSGATFQTDTPTSIALVRGTTYVVTVSNAYGTAATPPTATPPASQPPADTGSFPRQLDDRPQVLLTETVQASSDGVWLHRTYLDDPASGATSDETTRLSDPGTQVDEAVYEDGSDLMHRRTFADSTTGATWDTYENLGQPAPNGAGFATADQTEAASAAPLGVCRLTGDATRPYAFQPVSSDFQLHTGDILHVHSDADCPTVSVTSAVLLADPSGHVGRVDLAPRASASAVSLVAAGDVGGTSNNTITQASLAQPLVAQLQGSTYDLSSADGAGQTRQQAGVLHRAVQQVVAPGLSMAAPGVLATSTPTPAATPTTDQSVLTVHGIGHLTSAVSDHGAHGSDPSATGTATAAPASQSQANSSNSTAATAQASHGGPSSAASEANTDRGASTASAGHGNAPPAPGQGRQTSSDSNQPAPPAPVSTQPAHGNDQPPAPAQGNGQPSAPPPGPAAPAAPAAPPAVDVSHGRGQQAH